MDIAYKHEFKFNLIEKVYVDIRISDVRLRIKNYYILTYKT